MIVELTLLLILFTFSSGQDIRIFGGGFAEQNQLPHQVALIYRQQLRCGGSLIAADWVLTAAHCVIRQRRIIRQLSIMAGTNSLSSGGEVRAVSNSIPHRGYRNRLNDIALMRLESPLPFSDAIRPIEIATEEVPPGLQIVVAGWGKTSTFGTITSRLKVNTLRAMSRRGCLNSLGTSYSGIMCLGHSRNNGACYGDSGGSAIGFQAGVPKLVGVANFIVKSCGSSYPDAYAKVSFYRRWIEDTIWKVESARIEVVPISEMF